MKPPADVCYLGLTPAHLPATKDQAARLVQTIQVEVFRSFGEEVLTPESSEKIERVKARHLGLMTGADIKAMRERLQLPQKRLTSLLQYGEKTSLTGKTATAIRPAFPTPSCVCSMRGSSLPLLCSSQSDCRHGSEEGS